MYFLQPRAVTWRVGLQSSVYVITGALYKEGLVRSASLSAQVTASNKHLSRENGDQTGSAEGTDQTSWVLLLLLSTTFSQGAYYFTLTILRLVLVLVCSLMSSEKPETLTQMHR